MNSVGACFFYNHSFTSILFQKMHVKENLQLKRKMIGYRFTTVIFFPFDTLVGCFFNVFVVVIILCTDLILCFSV